jgi:hypothetical protein
LADQNIFHSHEFGYQTETQERYPKTCEKAAERFIGIRNPGMRAGPTSYSHKLLNKARFSATEETSRFERATRFTTFFLRAEAKHCDLIK